MDSIIDDLIRSIVGYLDYKSKLIMRRVCRKYRSIINAHGLNINKYSIFACRLSEELKINSLRISYGTLEEIVEFCNKHRVECLEFTLTPFLARQSHISQNEVTTKNNTIKKIVFKNGKSWQSGVLSYDWVQSLEHIIAHCIVIVDSDYLSEVCTYAPNIKKLCLTNAIIHKKSMGEWLPKFKKLTRLHIATKILFDVHNIINTCHGTTIRDLSICIYVQAGANLAGEALAKISEESTLERVKIICEPMESFRYLYFLKIEIEKKLKRLELSGGIKLKTTTDQDFVILHPDYSEPISLKCKNINKMKVEGYTSHMYIKYIGEIKELLVIPHTSEIIRDFNIDVLSKTGKMSIMLPNDFDIRKMNGPSNWGISKLLKEHEFTKYAIFRRNGDLIYQPNGSGEPEKKKQKISN